MREIKVRKIPNDVIGRLDDLAKQAKMSREEYVRRLLETHNQYCLNAKN